MSDQTTTLARLENIKAEIATVATVEDAKDIRDKAEAIRNYAKMAGYTLDIQNSAAEAKLRAERRCGELLRDDPAIGSGKKTCTLQVLGIEATQSHRWQKLASVAAAEFDGFIAETIAAHKELTTAAALRMARGESAEKALTLDDHIERIHQRIEQCVSAWPVHQRSIVPNILRHFADEIQDTLESDDGSI